MDIKEILAMIISGLLLATITSPPASTQEDYVGYMCMWIAMWTFMALVVAPLFKKKKPAE